MIKMHHFTKSGSQFFGHGDKSPVEKAIEKIHRSVDIKKMGFNRPFEKIYEKKEPEPPYSR